MTRTKRFFGLRYVPVLERLEVRKLLAGTANMAHFGGQVLCEDTDRKIADAVPGMTLPILAQAPMGTRGFHDITYTLSNGEDQAATSYTTSKGVEVDGPITVYHDFGQNDAKGIPVP